MLLTWAAAIPLITLLISAICDRYGPARSSCLIAWRTGAADLGCGHPPLITLLASAICDRYGAARSSCLIAWRTGAADLGCGHSADHLVGLGDLRSVRGGQVELLDRLADSVAPRAPDRRSDRIRRDWSIDGLDPILRSSVCSDDSTASDGIRLTRFCHARTGRGLDLVVRHRVLIPGGPGPASRHRLNEHDGRNLREGCAALVLERYFQRRAGVTRGRQA